MKIEFVKPHVPYEWQKHVLNNLTTSNCIVADRQKGKTELASEIAFSIMHSKSIKNPRIAIASDHISRCYRLYAERFNEHFKNNPHFNWTSEKQSSFTIPRKEGDEITINIFGTVANPYGMKGGSNHYFILDEYGLTFDGFFDEVASPTVDATGGIGFVCGTVEDNHWYDLYHKAQTKMLAGSPNWFSFYMSIGDEWCKKNFSDEWREAVKDKYDLKNPKDYRLFQKERMCNWFAASAGKIYSGDYQRLYKAGRLGIYPYDPKYKVGITLDNGHTTAIWYWQIINSRVRLIKYQEYIEEGFQHIAKDTKQWYNNNEAELDTLVFPHTMKARQQSAAMKSNAEVFVQSWGGDPKFIIVPKVHNLEEKIDATRRMLAISCFNESTTQEGLRCIRNYKRVYQKAKGFITKAEDKQWSHGADALGELALCLANGIFDDSMNRVVSSIHKAQATQHDVLDEAMSRFEYREGLRKIKSKTYLGGY